MADAKISALTAASTPLAGTEVLPIVQSGTTKKVAVSSLTAGRAVSTGVLTVVNGTNPYIEMPDGTGTTYIQVASGDLNFVPRSGKNVSISNSNLVIGTAAKGIDFSANTHAAGMTSELLDWYEEGACSMTVTAISGTITTGSVTAIYTRVGRSVTVTGTVSVSDNGTGAGALTVSGLPFTPSGNACGVGRESVNNGKTVSFMVSSGSTAMSVQAYDNTYPVSSGSTILFSVTYTV